MSAFFTDVRDARSIITDRVYFGVERIRTTKFGDFLDTPHTFERADPLLRRHHEKCAR